MSGRTILVTGGAGFIGSNFLRAFLRDHPQDRLINLDSLTYAGSLKNLEGLAEGPRYRFIKGDIRNGEALQTIFSQEAVTDVIHFAAESHVDASIAMPDAFITTNIEGTFRLLEAARSAWAGDFAGRRFYHVSTDEVYGSLGAVGTFTEESPYRPNSPYSASKASSDMLVRAYWRTYGLPAVWSNCSNNFGAAQHDEKFIPTVIRKALGGEAIPVYGRGDNVRDWLYVEDHCRAIDLIFHKAPAGAHYNIGGGVECSNKDLAVAICRILDAVVPQARPYGELIAFVEDRPGHDFRYSIDSKKLCYELDWRPQAVFQEALRETVLWYGRKYGKL